MICIGTAFAVEREGFMIAAKVHKRLRYRVLEVRLQPNQVKWLTRRYQRVEEEPVIDLASLQTFLLVNTHWR